MQQPKHMISDHQCCDQLRLHALVHRHDEDGVDDDDSENSSTKHVGLREFEYFSAKTILRFFRLLEHQHVQKHFLHTFVLSLRSGKECRSCDGVAHEQRIRVNECIYVRWWMRTETSEDFNFLCIMRTMQQ